MGRLVSASETQHSRVALQDSMRVLARMQQNAAFVREREREKMSKESAAEEERRANLLVDWHDFVVVETIGFEDDDDEALPAPQELSGEPSTDQPADTSTPAAVT